jgi:hypothetical protein
MAWQSINVISDTSNKPVFSVAHTVWPWSCGDPSRRSSARGQPELVGAQTRSSSNHLAALYAGSGSPASTVNIWLNYQVFCVAAPCCYERNHNSSEDGVSMLYLPSQKEFCCIQAIPLSYEIQHNNNHQFIFHSVHHLWVTSDKHPATYLGGTRLHPATSSL